ncbi:hypothetical protein EJ02DRAFT_71853 [Clathrospora elynae]|uniref:Uncharacterized protein n=1 Tax=Clathrospora elynae TaxID=706981 RepID=A0A6A5SZ00_9PLEO|nr:hypothetical protein EJ02DRAFT_71853 [Clathrospora elynae]
MSCSRSTRLGSVVPVWLQAASHDSSGYLCLRRPQSLPGRRCQGTETGTQTIRPAQVPRPYHPPYGYQGSATTRPVPGTGVDRTRTAAEIATHRCRQLSSGDPLERKWKPGVAILVRLVLAVRRTGMAVRQSYCDCVVFRTCLDSWPAAAHCR